MTTSQSAGTKRRLFIGLLFAAAFLVVALLLSAALRDSGQIKQTLGWASPVIRSTGKVGESVIVFSRTKSLVMGGSVCGVSAAAALFLFLLYRRRSLGAGFILLALGLGGPAKGLLIAKWTLAGVAAYFGALILGIVGGCFIKGALDDAPMEESPDRKRTPISIGEAVFVSVLTVIAALLRLFALEDIPEHFYAELMAHMIQASSWKALQEFMAGWDFVGGNSAGSYQMFLMCALYKAFGVSLFTIRLTAALPGIVTIPIFYGFLRNVYGRTAAIFGSLFLTFSALHLAQSRSDFACYIFVPLLAICMGWLTAKAVEKRSYTIFLLLAVAIPASHFVYTPGQVAWLVPVAVFIHLLFFNRRRLRRVWPAVGFILVGVALWICSLSLTSWAVQGRPRWISPVQTQGSAAWNRAVSTNERFAAVTQTAVMMKANFSVLFDALFRSNSRANHFFPCWRPADCGGLYVNGIVGVILVPAIGLLLAKFRKSKAFLLLCWIPVSLIPGLLSAELAERRITLLFPAIYTCAAVLIAVLFEEVRNCSGKGGRWVLGILSVPVLAVVILMNVCTMFNVPSHRPLLVEYADFYKKIMEKSDLVIHHVRDRDGMVVELMLHDRLNDVKNPAAVQHEFRQNWPYVAYHPLFRGDSYIYTLDPALWGIRDKLRDNPPFKSIAYILEDMPVNQEWITLLKQIYPNGEETRWRRNVGEWALWAYQVPVDEPRRLGRLQIDEGKEKKGAEFFKKVLNNIPFDIKESEPLDSPIIEGGITIKELNWYSFNWNKECRGAQLRVDGVPVGMDEVVPLTKGVHLFDLTLTDPNACQAPLDLLWKPSRNIRYEPIPSDCFLRPETARIEKLEPESIQIFPGHRQEREVGNDLMSVRSIAYDASNGFTAVCTDFGNWTVHRVTVTGDSQTSWPPNVGFQPGELVAATKPGRITLVGWYQVFSYTPTGEMIGSWKPGVNEAGISAAYDPKGNLWIVYPSRHAAICYDDNMKELVQLEIPRTEDREFSNPCSVDFDGRGYLYVSNNLGWVQIFSPNSANGNFTFDHRFKVAASTIPFDGRLSAVDSQGFYYCPDEEADRMLVYDPTGVRCLAKDPGMDINGMDIKFGKVIAADGGRILIHDLSRKTIRVLTEPGK